MLLFHRRRSHRINGIAGLLSFGCSVLVIVSLGPTAPAQQAPAGSQPSVTTLSVTTREVLLDVLVTDAAGRPVTGLKTSDFNVQEEGAPQTIKSLNEHHPMSAADTARLVAPPALPPNTFTNFTPVLNTNASTVILLDALDTPLSSQMYLRQQVINYLKNMQPGASIAIFQLDTEMRLIQSFSSDQQMLLAAAESKRDMPSLQRPIRGSNEEYRRVKREILREGLQSIGRYLAAFPGRKNLIWFTGEVPLTIFGTGLGTPFKDSFVVQGGGSPDDLSELADALTLSRVAVYPIDTRGLQVDTAFDVTRKGPPSPGSHAHFESRQAFDHMDLDSVAAATGGRAYYNTNGLKDVIAEIVNNGSNYYSLAYTTDNKRWDGQLRHIKVTVDRPGVTLQYRNGYYAINRDEVEQRQLAALQKRLARAAARKQSNGDSQAGLQAPVSASAPDDGGAMVTHPPKGGLTASMALGAVAPTELIFTASLAEDDEVVKLDKKAPLPPNNFLRPAYQGKPFRTYTVLFRADARRLQLTQTPDGVRHGNVEFIVVVYDPSGETVNSVQSTASFDLGETVYNQTLQAGLPVKAEIAVPVKGNYFLRLGIHDVTGDQVGALEIPVDQVKPGVAGQGLQMP